MGAHTRFQRLITEGGPGDNMPHRPTDELNTCERVIFCSGKIFYELYHARAARRLKGRVELARLEQIAPFPSIEVVLCATRHPGVDLVWAQEEPKNMGAWSYVAPRFATALRQLSPPGCAPLQSLRYVGRPSTALTATAL